MINCNTAPDRLGAYMDGELNARTRAAMKAHLAVCPDCRRELAALQAMTPVMKTLDPPLPPPFLATRILARARENARPARRIPGLQALLPWKSRWMAPAALACGLVVGTAMGLSSHSPLEGLPPMARLAPADSYVDCLCSTYGWNPAGQSSIEAATLAVMEN